MVDLLWKAILETWRLTSEMAPYLVFGFLVAGLISVFITTEKVEKHLGNKGILPIFKAGLAGIPLPLCSCGVIPVAASLRRHGASKAATASFLISTPQTGVDSILVTFSLLGPVFAIFRPFAALVSGIFGGLVVGIAKDRPGEEGHGHGGAPGSCCEMHAKARGPWWKDALAYGFLELPKDIGKHLLVGLLAAGAISVAIPDDFFSNVLGSGIIAMVSMLVFGLPLYVCATASVPIAAALIAKGISPGAAFVFLMVGPATNAASIATLLKILGKKQTAAFLLSVCVSALCSGLLLDLIYSGNFYGTGIIGPGMTVPPAVGAVSAVFLLFILVFPMFSGRKDK